MDVYLSPGPSTWHIFDSDGSIPIPLRQTPHAPQQHPEPTPPQPPSGHAADHTSFKAPRNASSLSQGQRQHNVNVVPAQAPAKIRTQQGDGQGEGQAAQSEEQHQQFQEGNKMRQPIWDEELQSVRWEWR